MPLTRIASYRSGLRLAIGLRISVPTGLPETPYEAKPLFHPHDGVRPFWNIGSFGSPHDASRLQEDGTTGRRADPNEIIRPTRF